MPNNIHILIVDDNIINRQYFSMSLKKSGYAAFAVESGFDALELAQKQVFDLILMDIRMPDMDGYETTKKIRLLPAREETIIIATSAENIAAEKASLFNDFLLKPISPKQLIKTVEYFCTKPTITTKIFNQANALDYAYNDKKIMCHLIKMFVKELPQQFMLLEANIKNNIQDDCYDIIHKLRGSSKTCGAQALDKQLEILSTIIKQNRVGDILDHLNKVQDAMNQYQGAVTSL